MKTSQFPDVWKLARISLVNKKANEDSPITLICNFGNVFEFFLKANIYNKIIYQELYHLSNMVLLEGDQGLKQTACEILDEGGQLDVVYIDFFIASDNIGNELLIYKLK